MRHQSVARFIAGPRLDIVRPPLIARQGEGPRQKARRPIGRPLQRLSQTTVRPRPRRRPPKITAQDQTERPPDRASREGPQHISGRPSVTLAQAVVASCGAKGRASRTPIARPIALLLGRPIRHTLQRPAQTSSTISGQRPPFSIARSLIREGTKVAPPVATFWRRPRVWHTTRLDPRMASGPVKTARLLDTSRRGQLTRPRPRVVAKKLRRRPGDKRRIVAITIPRVDSNMERRLVSVKRRPIVRLIGQERSEIGIVVRPLIS